MMNSYLDRILQDTKESVLSKKKKYSFKDFLPKIQDSKEVRGFISKIKEREKKGLVSVIAESKKASPSQGLIRNNYNPSQIAKSYSQNNATCLSILTNEEHFMGSLEHLKEVHSKFDIPLLRKDFIIDEYQIYESRASGADCILLIVAALSNTQLREFYSLGVELGMDVLVEVHDEEETKKAIDLNPEIIGINNRNLKTFKVNLETTRRLSSFIPEDIICVSESGIKTENDVNTILSFGVKSFLVGESFMRAKNPGLELKNLFSLS